MTTSSQAGGRARRLRWRRRQRGCRDEEPRACTCMRLVLARMLLHRRALSSGQSLVKSRVKSGTVTDTRHGGVCPRPCACAHLPARPRFFFARAAHVSPMVRALAAAAMVAFVASFAGHASGARLRGHEAILPSTRLRDEGLPFQSDYPSRHGAAREPPIVEFVSWSPRRVPILLLSCKECKLTILYYICVFITAVKTTFVQDKCRLCSRHIRAT